jgi:hypothetical protein
MMKKLAVALLLLVLIGCSGNNIEERHKKYVESFGMEIKSRNGSNSQEVNSMFPERKQIYKNMGIDLEPYRDKTINFTSYLLKERCQDEYGTHKMAVTIMEYNSQIIGAYISREDGNPGATKIVQKDEVLNKLGCATTKESD